MKIPKFSPTSLTYLLKQVLLSLFGVVLASSSTSLSLAAVEPNSLFSDHVVLQRGVDVPVWGRADEGETVKVIMAGQQLTTIATGGKWLVRLKALQAGGPHEMIIEGNNRVIIKDILVGEVWVCSGQSNMERQLGPRPRQKPISNWQQERDMAQFPEIRQFAVPRRWASVPPTDVNSKWVVCSPTTVSDFSAIGYFFAKHLHKTLNVPIGMVFSAVGGTAAESWTSRATMEDNPELKNLVAAYDKSLTDYPSKLATYREAEPDLLQQFRLDSAKAWSDKSTLPRRPSPPANPQNFVGGLYNGMVMPLQPYAIKGVIWYQGESNNSRANQYQALFSALIINWRTDWAGPSTQSSELPFLFVQIAPYKTIPPELREAQLLTWQSMPNTATG